MERYRRRHAEYEHADEEVELSERESGEESDTDRGRKVDWIKRSMLPNQHIGDSSVPPLQNCTICRETTAASASKLLDQL